MSVLRALDQAMRLLGDDQLLALAEEPTRVRLSGFLRHEIGLRDAWTIAKAVSDPEIATATGRELERRTSSTSNPTPRMSRAGHPDPNSPDPECTE